MATAPKAAPKVVPLDDAAKGGAKSNKKLIIIAASVALLLGGAGGTWFFLKGDKEEQHEEAPVKKAKQDPGKPPVFLPVEPFTVNLQPGEGSEQYLQVAMTLQVADPAEVEQIKQYMPLVRSRILLLLAGKKGSELVSTEGKEKLQAEIAELVNKPFMPKGPEQDVSGVFFTSFVIQ